MRLLPLLALLACKGPVDVPTTDIPPLTIVSVPEPLAPCGDATVTIELGGDAPALQTVRWELGEAFGDSPLDGEGTTRTFDLPAQALLDSCVLPACQLSLVTSIELGLATVTTETDVVVLIDVDPEVQFDNDPPEDFPSPFTVTDEILEVELDLVATAPELLLVEAAACLTGTDDCIRAPMTYDGGGDWLVDAIEVESCRPGDLKADWELTVDVSVPMCDTPLVRAPIPLRLIVEDCDADTLLPTGTDGGDCDDFDPDLAVSEGVQLYIDDDFDGYGDLDDPGVFICPLDPPPIGPVSNLHGDCDDADPNVYPTQEDRECNGVDDDCDGVVDDNAPIDTVYPDVDGDGYGLPGSSQMFVSLCDLPIDGWGLPGECDEDGPNAAQINPGVDEDPATPYDDNCDEVEVCGIDCDSEPELLIVSDVGLIALTELTALPYERQTVREWSPVPRDVGFVDLDGNGYLDAVQTYASQVVVDYDLALAETPAEVLSSAGGTSIQVGDFDKDGIQDVLVGSAGPATIYWGDGTAPIAQDLDPGELVGVGDFDGNGCDDLVVLDTDDGTSFDTTSTVYFGQPNGFQCNRTFDAAPFSTSGPVDFAIGQLDGLAGPELVIAESQFGTVGSPFPAMESLIVHFVGQTPTLVPVPVTSATHVDVSEDLRLAIAHQPNFSNLGVSLWTFDGTTPLLEDTLEGTDVTNLMWFPAFTVDAIDLLVLTDLPGGFDRFFREGDPNQMELLAFDLPSSDARLVSLPLSPATWQPTLVVGRHPNGVGTNNTRMYQFTAVGIEEGFISEPAAFAPYMAFTPNQYNRPFPPQVEPE